MGTRRARSGGVIAVRDQTALGCNLYRAVAKHFDRITVFAGQVIKHSDDRSLGVVAEPLIDLVTNRKF
jgi:hypothetical protein